MRTITYSTSAQCLGLHLSQLCVSVWASICRASVSRSWAVQDTSGILLLSRSLCYLWPDLVHIPSPLYSSLWGLYCNVCVAVNAGDGFICMYSPHKQYTAYSLASDVSFQTYPWNKRNFHLEIQMRIRILAHARTACMHSHRHSRTPAMEISKLECTIKGGAHGPPDNLMHGDHFQNRTKWWTTSQWQSGSLRGPRGRMACNCVHVLPE